MKYSIKQTTGRKGDKLEKVVAPTKGNRRATLRLAIAESLADYNITEEEELQKDEVDQDVMEE